MKKVYLVITEEGSWDDFMWNIYCICSSKEIAEKEEEFLKNKIKAIKEQYKKTFHSDYDLDYKNRMELDQEKRYSQIYKYEREYPELKFHTIKIETKNVITE